MNHFCGWLLCSFLLTAGSPLALAATPEQMEKAAILFEAAEKNYKVGDYEKALEGYKEAYVLSGEADLLFNIGQCQRKLGRNEEALRTYKNFLQERPDTPIKADVEVIIRELELAQNKPPVAQKAAPLLFGGADTFFSIGGGLALGFGEPAPMLSGIMELKRFEFQARFAGLDFLAGGLDAGVRVVTSPRSDQNVRSLLNITAGPSVSTLFTREKNVNIFVLMLSLSSDAASVAYERRARHAGESKWTVGKLMKLAFDSVITVGYLPLKTILWLGVGTFSGSILILFYLLIAKLAGLIEVSGWASTMALITAFGGIQMVAIAVLGEYLWRNFDQTRDRPIFIIEQGNIEAPK